MKRIIYSIFLFFALGIFLVPQTSCTKEGGLSESEIIEGLKEALKIGAKNSSDTVSRVDGYFKDALIKILLPPEAQTIYELRNNEYISNLPIFDYIDDIILGINRSAEAAAKEVVPIFVNSVTKMSISDGMSILKGSDTAASHYLRKTTFVELVNLFKPGMDEFLSKPILGKSYSTKEFYDLLVDGYNDKVKSLGSVVASLAGLKQVNKTDIVAYSTGKAMDGLFYKIKQEEIKIRKNPLARVTDILKKVFGELD